MLHHVLFGADDICNAPGCYNRANPLEGPGRELIRGEAAILEEVKEQLEATREAVLELQEQDVNIGYAVRRVPDPVLLI